MHTRVEQQHFLRLIHVFAIVVVLLAYLAPLTTVSAASGSWQKVTIKGDTVASGADFLATVDSADGVSSHVNSINAVTVTYSANVTFDESASLASSNQGGNLVSGQYTVDTAKRTVTFPAAQTADQPAWPLKLFFKATNATGSTATATIGAYCTTNPEPATATITVTPQATASSSNSAPSAATSSSVITKEVRSAAAQFDPTQYKFNATSAVADAEYPGGPLYPLSDFPLFYVAAKNANGDPIYTVMHNNTGSIPTAFLQAMLAGTVYGITGSAYSTSVGNGAENLSASATPSFTKFYDATGKTTTTDKFVQGQTYTLMPNIAIGSTFTGYPRMVTGRLSGQYYMPNGYPSFTLDASGKLQLVDKGDGKAKSGQYSIDASGKQINLRTFKMKRLRVVYKDANGKDVALPNVTVTFNGMQATTGTSGDAGGIVPKGYKEGSALYWDGGTDGDGTQHFQSMTGVSSADYYVPGGSFDLKLSADDQLTVASDTTGMASIDATTSYSNHIETTVTLTLKKKADLPVAQRNLSLKKTDEAGTALSGAKFEVAEVGANTTDKLAKTTLDATGSDGLTQLALDQTSGTAERLVTVREAQAPSGYTRDAQTYYAKWQLGRGFVAVGTSQDSLGDSAGSATIAADGTLMFSDTKVTTPVPEAGGTKIQYVNASGDGINNAALPALPNMSTVTYNGESFSGLSGLILPDGADQSQYMRPATPSGDGFLLDSSMATSTAVSAKSSYSGAPGVGAIQSLWLQNRLPASTGSGDLYALINQAISDKTILSVPTNLEYAIQNLAMRGRATGAGANGYYTFAQALQLYEPSQKKIAGQVDADYAPALMSNKVAASGNTFKVYLQKVKQIHVANNGDQALVVRFKTVDGQYMQATTDTSGNGELVPVNQDGTAASVFAWPRQALTLDSIKTTSGATVDLSKLTAGSLSLSADTDKLALAGNDATKAAISSDGQTVNLTLPTAPVARTVDLLAVNQAGGNQAGTTVLAGAKYQLTRLNADGSTAATDTVTTGADGKVGLKLAGSVDTATFTLKETTAPSGYSRDLTTYTFTWQAGVGVTELKRADGSTTKSQGDSKNGGLAVVNADGSLTLAHPQRLAVRYVDADTDAPVTDMAAPTLQLSDFQDKLGQTYAASSSTADANGRFTYTFFDTFDVKQGKVFKLSPSTTTTTASGYLPDTQSHVIGWYGVMGIWGLGQTGLATNNGNKVDGQAAITADPDTVAPELNCVTIKLYHDYSLQTLANLPGGAVAAGQAKVALTGDAASKTFTTDASGYLHVTPAEIAALAGTAGTPGTTAQLTVDVDGGSATTNGDQRGLGSISQQSLSFTFPGKGGLSGFAQASGNGQVDTTDPIAAKLYLRRTVVYAQAAADASGYQDATFALTYTKADGASQSTTVQTQGTAATLLDPSQLFGTDWGASAEPITVTITQVTAPDVAANTTPLTLTYTSQNGYTKADASLKTGTTVADRVTSATGQAVSGLSFSQWQDSPDVTTQSVESFMNQGRAAGTQIGYRLAAAGAVAFTDVPEAGMNLNFGRTDWNSGAKVLPALDTTDADQLAEYYDETGQNVATPTTLNAGTIGVSLTQTGVVAGGWTVTLGVDQDAAATALADSTITFENGKLTRTTGQSPTLTGSKRTVYLNGVANDPAVMMDSDGKTSGNYLAYWLPKDVNLHLPDLGVGAAPGDYRWPLSWNLVYDVDTGVN